VDTYQIYNGTDENRIVGTVAPGLFAQEGRCWRMVYENPVGQCGHCLEPVGVGLSVEVPRRLDEGVWGWERRADELIGARRVIGKHELVKPRPSCHVVVRFDL
jgi:hypothetical protein